MSGEKHARSVDNNPGFVSAADVSITFTTLRDTIPTRVRGLRLHGSVQEFLR